MEMAPSDIRQQKFKVRFRGFDIEEVDEYLDQLAPSLSGVQELAFGFKENRPMQFTYQARDNSGRIHGGQIAAALILLDC